MKGKHHIVIETARLKYEFEIRRNITIVRGDSATGKTTLIELLQAYAVQGVQSGVHLSSDVPCLVYSGDPSIWQTVIQKYHDSIVFIDENYNFIASKEFAETIRNTDNYYVLITRRELVNLPYSINEIYGIRTSGKYHFPHQIYHEFYQIYSSVNTDVFERAILVTEDSNAGFQFYSSAFGEANCISAKGNGNIYKKILEIKQNRPLVVIADGAAFGAFIEKVVNAAQIRRNTILYFPESFEWLILKSGVVQSKDISKILKTPEKYIESSVYFSWERFFTDVLQKETVDNDYMKYSKTHLSGYYFSKANMKKILSTLPSNILHAMEQSQ